ncbi:hypothetical protein EN866_19350 [Mesorhizobium sp. M2D.F.Ca.ET.223.01.1.1]|uniref:hypothetical protein n=2 Tax=Mesorhizobium TaxID=68287 RepID=UPI000FC9F4E7|nr:MULTISPECIES: hypothetical protein [unclassified Mesorhizobium]TGP89317.1 hypothetical protein EN864_19360 [bacterium M00.F.Ca.ET.221.01.1.1]TGP94690.1 hypothetical protein EN865_15230 [bacterium M00.F.Ca.ET.222.01.1.1]RVD58896.1 hypothetical protein EN783_14765 [Mesorhizobium sp. M2D.F.Ca.ET.140.01.1.1]TGP27925.1 hypothetical protein EN875_033250 [Mesorhizobium sp. M2D.F.Ca.ET.232.01.1.1]TGP75858.1 hypothetical protein EN867_15230 [Mesorhizobium sp. M2D.F.Ca.ET.224.01.1.1]
MATLPAKPKLCFVVGPIGGNDSDDRVHADWLLEGIIQPVFDEHFPEFRVERADKISNPGRIDEQIITALLSAELVIADITNLNPNAFYEIGIRHAIQKPTIHMHLEGQKIPFDISSFRSIEFSRKRPKDLEAARDTLTDFVRTVTAEDYVVDNPVTFSRGKVEFAKTATPSEKIVQDQLSDIVRRLATIENRGASFGFTEEISLAGKTGKFRVYRPREMRDTLALKDTIVIGLRPKDLQGLRSFSRDVDALASSHLADYSISRSEASAEIKVAATDFNREALKSLIQEAEEMEVEVHLFD